MSIISENIREALIRPQVWTTKPDGTYGAGERIDLFVGFRIPVRVDSDRVVLAVNTEPGGEPFPERFTVVSAGERREGHTVFNP